MKLSSKNLTACLSLLLIVFAFSSCVKKDFDEPPKNGENPKLVVNASIAKLKALFSSGPVRVDSNYIISGVVTADDKSGNFYKSIVIQDSTAGILIRLDESNFYTSFPIGRRVFVKCKGLYLGDYSGLVQLGGYVDYTVSPPSVQPIPLGLISQYILKGEYYVTVVPKLVTLTQINNPANFGSLQNMLIQLDDVQFAETDTGMTYADAVGLLSVNRKVEDCDGNFVALRSSGYANFATQKTPAGKGTLVTIFQIYTGSSSPPAQLLIRDVSDVKFDGPRCPKTILKLLDLRNLYHSGTTTCPAGFVRGIVISDKDSGNITGQNMVLQDSTGGIVVRFSSSHIYKSGDDVEIKVSGLAFTEYHNLLEIDNTPNANASKKGTGTITPAVVTIPQLLANAEAWQSTLIKLNSVVISGGDGTYGGGGNGSRTLTDGSLNTVTLYTLAGASFANTNYPFGNHNITSIVSQYNTTVQLTMRSTADVQ